MSKDKQQPAASIDVDEQMMEGDDYTKPTAMEVDETSTNNKNDEVSNQDTKEAAVAAKDAEKTNEPLQQPRSYQLEPGSQEWLLIESIQQFVDFLKENLDNATLKYKFPQYKRMVWVLDNKGESSTVAEVIRMLILCSFVVSERGEYGPRRMILSGYVWRINGNLRYAKIGRP